MSLDPNRLILTGENPFIRLSDTDGGAITTNASFWRILISPAGPGHVLYLKSELTQDRWKIYSDNIAMARWTEQAVSHDEEIALTWYDIGEPLLIHTEPGPPPARQYGVCTVLIPALGARLTVNGVPAKGRPFPNQREGRPFSTCALAFSESWTQAR
jgi:hypothetical protein